MRAEHSQLIESYSKNPLELDSEGIIIIHVASMYILI